MSQAVSDLIRDGLHRLPFRLDARQCAEVVERIRATRPFGPGLFLEKGAFEEEAAFTGVNPRPGRNLYEQLQPSLAFIEQHPALVETLRTVLGENYVSLHHKVVCGVPESWIPDWLRARILGNAVNNLGPYVLPEYRDMTYFYGIDYHQDLIDWKNRAADFVTLYVYLHPVGAQDAPLHLLPGSHRFGATVFPHDLTRSGEESIVYLYGDGAGREMECEESKLIGPTGTAALWHAATLHGTQPDVADKERLSLRYLYARDPGAVDAGIDAVNRTIEGPLALDTTRVDLGADGDAVLRQNAINESRVRR